MDRPKLALDAVKSRPGCSAWALGVLATPPQGMNATTWRALLEDELPKLHAVGLVEATRYGVGAVAYWPARYEVPAEAGDMVRLKERRA